MPVMIRRLLKSDTWVLGTDSERAAAIALWLESWHEIPAASIPADDRKLAHLAQSRTWPKVRDQVMRGWVLCTDGRYYHRIVAWKAMEAWLEKLLAQATGGATNAKRWGTEFDGPTMLARLQDAVRRLQELEPSSKYLRKKAVVQIMQGVLPGSHVADAAPPIAPLPEQPPPTDSTSPPASGAGSAPDSHANRNRKGKGTERDRDREKEKDSPLSGNKPPRPPRKRGGTAASGADTGTVGDTPLVTVDQLVNEGVNRKHAEDWLAVRKDKRLPLTRAAWEQTCDQASFAGITPAAAVHISASNSWAGFKASWLGKPDTKRPDLPHAQGNRQEQLEDANRALALRMAGQSKTGEPA